MNICCLFRSIHKQIEGYAVNATNDQLSKHVGRQFGGIGVLWRNTILHVYIVCDLQDVRLLGIDLETNYGKFLF